MCAAVRFGGVARSGVLALACLCAGTMPICGCAGGAESIGAAGPKGGSSPKHGESGPVSAGTGQAGAEVMLTPATTSEFGVRGETLVLPMMPVDKDGRPISAESAAFPRFGTMIGATDEGKPLTAEPVALISESVASWKGMGAWLALPGVWREVLTPVPADAVWFARVSLPKGSSPKWISLGGKRVDVSWVDAPARTEGGSRIAASEALRVVLRLLAAEPGERWRGAMLASRLGVAEEAPPGDEPAVVRALARQIDGRWRTAMARLRSADAALERQAALALTALVEFDDGIVAPAWPAGRDTLTVLLGDLLAASIDDRGRAERARAWLASLPAGAAWQVEEGCDRGVARIASAELLGERVVASATFSGVRPGDSAAGVEMAPMEPFTTRQFRVAWSGAGSDHGPIQVRVGRWFAALPALAAPVAAAPPGVRMGPFLEQRTMASWLAGQSYPTDPSWSTAALLQRRAGGSGWEIVLDCRTPVGAGADGPEDGAGDGVRVFLGPLDRPVSVLRVDPRGYMVDETERARPTPVAVMREPGRWTAVVALPARATASSPMPIALERTDSRGVRTTWPRAVFPWQPAPGRVGMDLDAWQGLETFVSPR